MTARTVKRQVTTTRRVRRSVTIELTPRRALRLGLKLVIAGLRAAARRRPVRLTLGSRRTTQEVESGEATGDIEPVSDEPTIAS